MSDWIWPEDDLLVVNCNSYWTSAYRRRGLSEELLAARRDYEGIKQFDEALFGNELDAA